VSETSDPKKPSADRFVGNAVLFALSLVVPCLSAPKPPPAPDRTDVERQKATKGLEEWLKHQKQERQEPGQRINPLRLLEERLKKLPPVDSLERQELEQLIDALRRLYPGPQKTTGAEKE
jgi:hypothetical protein